MARVGLNFIYLFNITVTFSREKTLRCILIIIYKGISEAFVDDLDYKCKETPPARIKMLLTCALCVLT